jgi:hypothetical protein
MERNHKVIYKVYLVPSRIVLTNLWVLNFFEASLEIETQNQPQVRPTWLSGDFKSLQQQRFKYGGKSLITKRCRKSLA